MDPSEVSGSLQKGMQRRVILSSHLKTKTNEEDLPPFGPGQLGCLFQLKAEDMESDGVMSSEVLEHLRLFVTLSYVEGRKYTLGTKYISRMSQGEFVFIDLTSGSSDSDGPLKEGNYLTLQCKEDTLWISSHGVEGLCASSLILVNGTMLTRTYQGKEDDNLGPDTLERELVFGDLISIFESDEGGGTFLDLVFQPPFTTWSPRQEMNPSDNDTDESHGIEFKLLTNPMIAEKILYFLPTKSIKSLRALCQVWNVEGLKLLRNRVVVTPFYSCGRTDSADRLMQVSTYANSQLKHLNFPYWRIPRKIEYNRKEDKHDAMKEKKLLEDVIWLFDPAFHTHRIQSLKCQLLFDKSCDVLGAVLRGVKDTLDTLTLYSSVTDVAGLPFCDVQSLRGIDFPRLKSLELSLHHHDLKNEDLEAPVRSFIQPLLQAANSIQTLTLGLGEIHSSSRYEPCSLVIMEEMAKLQSGDPARRFPNLTNITVACQYEWESEILLLLSSLPMGGLKKLQFHSYASEIDLRVGLQTHADTLEELVLYLDLTYGDIKFDLPKRMPKLKDLSIYHFMVYNDLPSSLRFNVGQWDDEDAVQRRLDYGWHFPSLSNLTVWPVAEYSNVTKDYTKDGEEFWGMFWPTLVPFVGTPADIDGPMVPISSLRNLDIPFVLRGKYHPRLDNLETQFPNVVFPPELAEARLGPTWAGVEDDVEEEERQAEDGVEEEEGQAEEH